MQVTNQPGSEYISCENEGQESMEEKNRFSKLLNNLMTEAELKNNTLAQELQYDVSYISKWVSGRMIPAEKSSRKILNGISQCIVNNASEAGRRSLMENYQVDNIGDLKSAILDNIMAEYNYVNEMKKNTGNDVAPKTLFFPELNLSQYIGKMHHPVLRRVNSLDVVAVMDLMAVDHEYRIQFTMIENEHIPDHRGYPDVHYSMILNIQPEKWDYLYDTLFLIHLLTDNTFVDFQLYGDEQAAGRLIFAVKDDFVISGLLINTDRCISVALSEEVDNCNTIYKNMKAFCSKERLLFRRVQMSDLLLQHDYVHNLLSPNLRWVIGHLTEHFLPDELFEEILEELSLTGKLTTSVEVVRNTHRLAKKVMEESHIRMMIYETAFSNLVTAHSVDFYNHKVYLSAEQRMKYMKHMLALCENYENLEIRLVYGKFISDFEFADDQCIFLSDTISCIRLKNVGSPNNMMLVNRFDMQKILEQSFETCWEYEDNVVIYEKEAIVDYVKHMMRGMEMVMNME